MSDVQDSPDSVHVQAAPNAPILVNIDKGIGKQLLLVLWLSSFVAAAAVIAVIVMCFWVDRLSARIYVQEYDNAQMRAQLIEKGLIERTGH